jgi:hypothetical protein
MTVLVSAICVRGIKRLKTFIGRARESKATAEAELLSSTSDEVCEMWNGLDIAWTYGSSKIVHKVLVHHHDKLIAYDLPQAYKNGYLIDCTWPKTWFW